MLLQVLDRLVDAGNTVLVIEHHVDVIKRADWVIEMGPGAGEAGGRVVFQGTPEELATAGTETSGYVAGALRQAEERQLQSQL